MSATNSPEQDKLKRVANAIRVFLRIPQHQALDEASRIGGFRNYDEAKRLLDAGEPVRTVRIDNSRLISDTTCSVSLGPSMRCEFRPSQSICQAHDGGSPQEGATGCSNVVSTKDSSPAAG